MIAVYLSQASYIDQTLPFTKQQSFGPDQIESICRGQI